jgi:hypothetical protein
MLMVVSLSHFLGFRIHFGISSGYCRNTLQESKLRKTGRGDNGRRVEHDGGWGRSAASAGDQQGRDAEMGMADVRCGKPV